MLPQDHELRPLFDAIEAQWDKAEEYVKRAERLRRGLVVGASINEFRYAGRRLVEAYSCLKACEGNEEKKKEAVYYLGEVKQCCMRAQHDAMDAAVTYVDQALAKYENDFGADLLHDKFSHYVSMKGKLREISALMAESRGNREQRDGLYQKIRDGLIEELIDQHHELESSEAILTTAYSNRIRAEKREALRFWITTGIAVVVGVATIVGVAIAFWPKPTVPTQIMTPVANSPSTGVIPDGPVPRRQ